MATIKSLIFTITRSSHAVGHICTVEYSYYLQIAAAEYHHDDAFSVVVELHGEDMLLDQTLGNRFYDAHVVDRAQEMPVSRNFVVPCEILDEALGTDKIYLKLVIKSSEGEVLTAKSETIADRF
ncbi:hypothetical protein [Kaarinaea lacus]